MSNSLIGTDTDNGSGAILQINGSVTQTGSTSSIIKTDSSGKLINAVSGTDFISPSQSAYTFLANNTNGTANMSTQVFNDQGAQTYTGTVTWGSANPPTGATNHTYRWTQVGKMVILSLQLVYGVASVGSQTNVTMTLPLGLPSPNIPSGLLAGDIIYWGTGAIYVTSNALVSTTNFNVGMFSDGLIRINRTSGASVRYAQATVTYWTA